MVGEFKTAPGFPRNELRGIPCRVAEQLTFQKQAGYGAQSPNAMHQSFKGRAHDPTAPITTFPVTPPSPFKPTGTFVPAYFCERVGRHHDHRRPKIISFGGRRLFVTTSLALEASTGIARFALHLHNRVEEEMHAVLQNLYLESRQFLPFRRHGKGLGRRNKAPFCKK